MDGRRHSRSCYYGVKEARKDWRMIEGNGGGLLQRPRLMGAVEIMKEGEEKNTVGQSEILHVSMLDVKFRPAQCRSPVSYTHLDVYKRQV